MINISMRVYKSFVTNNMPMSLGQIAQTLFEILPPHNQIVGGLHGGPSQQNVYSPTWGCIHYER